MADDPLIDGRWRMGAAIATGPWGDVHEALDELSGGGAAALLLLPRAHDDAPLGDPALLAGLEHRNVARMRAWGRVARGPGELVGRPYVALDPVRGQTLRALIAAQTRLDATRLGRLALDLLAALDAAHTLGVRHRRLLPEQVLVAPDGAKVLGLGLPALTIEGDAYVAPEVLRGGDGDARTDLYALGACLYEAATGRPPDRLVFVPARDLRPDLPSALERAIAALLDEDPRGRPASAGAARLSLLGALDVADHALEETPFAAPDPSRLVGRDDALEAIAAAVDEAQALSAAGRAAREAAPAGPPPFVIITAAPGLGRTRLLGEAAAQLTRRGARVLQGQVSSGGDPFGAWRALLEAARRQADAAADGPLALALEALGATSQQDALSRWERVARGLLALAARRPLALLLDDAHLLGEAGTALLLHVARAAQAPDAGGALALVVTARADGGERSAPLLRALGAPLAPAHRALSLAELSLEDARALARSLVHDDAVAARLAQLGGGDPSLLVELSRAHLRGGGPPASVQAALRSRLGGLGPAARALLEAIAVIGRPVPLAAAAELAPRGTDAADVLRGLMAAGLVRRHAAPRGVGWSPAESGPSYDLRDGLTRAVVRERLADAKQTCSAALTALARAGALAPGERARLMLQARLDGAVAAALEAAPTDPAPEELYSGAVDLLPAGPERARLRRELAVRLRARGAFAASRAALEAALADLGPARADTALDIAHTHLEQADVAMSEGRTREALERSTSGARVLQEHDLASGPLLARLLALEARAVTQHSDHAGAARLLALAKGALERDRDPALYARLEVDEANAWIFSLDRTRYEAARSRLEALVPRLVAAGDEAGAAHALRALGNLAYYSGDMSVAEERFRDALTRCERLGDLPVAAGLWNNVGLVARMRGELRRAEVALERSLDIAERLGQGSVICRALTNVGRVRRSLGDLRGAARSLTQAAEVARAVGDPMIESAAWSELGMARLAEGRSRAALAALLRARRLRRALGDPGRVAESELDLAELWRKGGDVRAALASTSRALALQASLGNGDGAAVAVEALEFATGRPGGPAALLETARRGPRASGPPPLPEAVRKGEALARLARRTLATAMAARAGDVQQARVHALHTKRLLKKVKAQAPAPGVLALARALRLEARAVLLTAGGRKGEARDLLDRALEDPALPAVRRGAIHLKRAFLDLALGDADRARQDAGRASGAGLPEPLAERRGVGRALVAGGAAQRDPGGSEDAEWPTDAPAPTLPEAKETARRLGDVALLAMVSTALAEEAAQDSRFDDATTERAAAAVAAGRLSLGLPASLRAGIERAHAPADAGRARPAPRAATARPAKRVEAPAPTPERDDDAGEDDEGEDVEETQERAPERRPEPRARETRPTEGVAGAMAGTTAIIGTSPAMRAVNRLIERYGRTTAPVTIHGESGTGKELVASALHRASPRRQGPFVAFNCAAVTDTLLESELFGVIKGAYTGADRDRKGLFELAHGGTLFMDEVGDMSLDMQAKLLRVLETGELRPVGGRQMVKVDVRIISASHHDLRALSTQGRMREDLFYRLNVLRIELPPLRERREDLPLLIDHFLGQVARDRGEGRRRLSPEALDVLLRHPFPGNVRELRNVIDRACVLESGDVVNATRLLVDAPPTSGPSASAAAQAKLPAYQRTYAYQGVALNRRQRQVLDYLAQGAAAVTNREFCAMADVSERTGLRDLTELVEQGILTRLGKRKGARYQLGAPGKN